MTFEGTGVLKIMIQFTVFLLMPISFADVVGASNGYQEQDTTVSVFMDAESLTIYLPDEGIISLVGLGFEYVADGQRNSVFLDQFENFAVLRLNEIPAPICLRLEEFRSDTPLPLVCHNVPHVIQVLAPADIFWFDREIRSTRPLILIRRAEPFKICTSSEVPCVFTFQPVLITPSPATMTPILPTIGAAVRTPMPATPIPTADNPEPGWCGNGLPWRLHIGARGRVTITETSPSTLRSQPGSPQPIGFMQPGEYFSVIDGPRCTPSNGVSWWFVKADDGNAGWVSEGNESVYWIEPS